jgi:hypothetical protein
MRLLFVGMLFILELFGKEYYFPKAKLSYNFFEHKKLYYSNDLNIEVNSTTPPKITFYEYNLRGDDIAGVKPSQYRYKDSFIDMKLPKSKDGKTIELDEITARKSSYISSGGAVFIELEDIVSNIDRDKIDQVDLTFQTSDDLEVIRVFESSKDSGVFRGYIQPNSYMHKNYDGLLYIRDGHSVTVTLQDRLTATLNIRSNLRSLSSLDSSRDIWLVDSTNKKVAEVAQSIKYAVKIENRVEQEISSRVEIDITKDQKIDLDSIKLDAIKVDESDITISKNRLFININIAPNEVKRVTYVATISNVSKDYIYHNVKVKNSSLKIKTKINNSFLTPQSMIVGRVGFGSMGIKGVKLYLDNGLSTITDSRGRYHFEGVTKDFHVVKVDSSTIDRRFKMVSCQESTRFAGSVQSQFIDTSNLSMQRADFCVKLKDQNSTKLVKDGYNYKLKQLKTKKMPIYTASSFNSIDGEQMLWPPDNFVPSFPSVKIAFVHSIKQKYKLYINDKEVDKLLYDGFVISKDKSKKIEKFRGVQIEPGDNRVLVKLFEDGSLVKELSSNIHFSHSPSKAVVDKELSYLVADGKHSPVIAVRLYDKDGFIAREGMIGDIKVSSPYSFADNDKEIEQSPLSIMGKHKYEIRGDGVAYIKLAPTTNSGVVKLNFDFQDRSTYTTAWLKAKQDEWMIVGFAKGSVGYEKIKQNLEYIGDKEIYEDSKVSFYTKGRILGDILLTLAYDSSKKQDLSMLDSVNLKKYYNVYADRSKQINEAPSSKKLYIKLEKDNFYTMFGDFKTALIDTKLGRYDKRVNGVKSEYSGENFSYTFFATNSNNIFHQDEIKPDGTSGRYYLSNKLIVENSENIYIQTRDYENENNIVKEELLGRHMDYNIDYDDGFVYFKQPQFSTDENLNPQYIVVRYQTNSEGSKHLTYGGRASYKVGSVEVGSTYIKKDQSISRSELLGIDSMLKLYEGVELKAEVATSKVDKELSYAKEVQLEYNSDRASIRAYGKKIDRDFGIDEEQSLKDKNQKTFGVKGSYQFNSKNKVELESYTKEQLDSKVSSQNYKTSYTHKGSSYTTKVGYLKSIQSGIEDDQVQAFVSKSLFSNSLLLKLKKNHSLNDSLINADLTEFGVDYRVNKKLTIFALERWTKQLQDSKKEAQVGVSSKPWKGSRVKSSIGSLEHSDAKSIFSNFGIVQDVKLTKNISLSAGYDKYHSLKSTTPNDSDHDTYFGSIRYKKGGYSYLLSHEYRDAKVKKINTLASINSALSEDSAMAFGIRENRSISIDESRVQRSVTGAIAYRPKKSDAIAINRVDIKQTKSRDQKSIKVVNNLYMDNKITKNISLDMQFGIKYLQNFIDVKKYRDLISLASLSATYDITKKVDLTSQASMTFSLNDKTYSYSAGTGVTYNAFKNSLIGVGYNVEGFDDSDFVSDIYRKEGPYLNFLVKFDEFNLKERAKRATQ